jgi:hypothetical protein
MARALQPQGERVRTRTIIFDWRIRIRLREKSTAGPTTTRAGTTTRGTNRWAATPRAGETTARWLRRWSLRLPFADPPRQDRRRAGSAPEDQPELLAEGPAEADRPRPRRRRRRQLRLRRGPSPRRGRSPSLSGLARTRARLPHSHPRSVALMAARAWLLRRGGEKGAAGCEFVRGKRRPRRGFCGDEPATLSLSVQALLCFLSLEKRTLYLYNKFTI